MRHRARNLHHILLAGPAIGCLSIPAQQAFASDMARQYSIAPKSLSDALRDFGAQSGVTILADGELVRGKHSSGYRARGNAETALRMLLRGTGLSFRRDGNVFVVTLGTTGNVAPTASQPIQSTLERDVEEIIVTAQKREEKIIDVPVAITAMSAKQMDDRKIEGGSELLRAVPNVNFSKSNFSMYNFSIRGVGTKSISASSDPAVAVSFNNTPLARNRLFESEFFDMERVEVLRGPQGTLYGRNTTAGVVNMISVLPKPDLAADIKLETGGYSTLRATGMLNVPITSTLGIRVAGQWTNRDGYDYNTVTDKRVNGRNLYSTRVTVGWEPSAKFSANAIWQHFNEDDDRSRTGKQLCKRDDPTQDFGTSAVAQLTRYRFSQGCLPTSLYGDDVYQAPSGYTVAYMFPIGNRTAGYTLVGVRPVAFPILKPGDPYGNVTSSKNLREISTTYDPVFRAKNDLFQLNMEFTPSAGLTFVSQTSFARDSYYSSQDFNRFDSGPIFNASNVQGLVGSRGAPVDPVLHPGITPNGKFCDPQLGCSDRLLAVDISQSKNTQWYQEFRLQSNFDTPLNFNLGANYFRFKTEDKYYVLNNMFTLTALHFYNGLSNPVTNIIAPVDCPLGDESRECIYVDPNPIGSMNDQGHNYFLSKNLVDITSKAVFGEVYWQAAPTLKVTLGARYTDDFKDSSQIPSQLLLGGGVNGPNPGVNTGGKVNSGYPAAPNIEQNWKSFTGRAVVDWKPNLSFTDDTLIYASVSHGYKGGGTNPPRVDINPAMVQYQPLDEAFRPEYVNAFEIGMKNSFDNGRFMLNATAFLYDYKDYQISQIVDRIAYNENFDAKTYGLEFEAAWRPTRRLRFDANLGLLRTRIADGQGSIDVMNRTAGNEDWVVIRPWVQTPSNCIAPKVLVDRVVQSPMFAALGFQGLTGLCPGSNRVGDYIPSTTGTTALDTLFGFTYDPMRPYDPTKVGLNIADGGSGAPNFARGFNTDLSGHELPNAPRLTFNIGADYTIPVGAWEVNLRGDYYRQSSSWARIYNTEYDRLRAWDNANLAITVAHPDQGFTAQLYVKNVFNKTPITDAFTNSDDTGLTTNVFTLDPRIWGVSLRKRF